MALRSLFPFLEVRMGMPTLKRFARPLDWAGLETALRGYARGVRKAQAHGEEARALPES